MKDLIIIRGGGDLATGVIHRLWGAGFSVLVLEIERPSAIRRKAAVSEAIYQGSTEVEGMTARAVNEISEIIHVLSAGEVPVLTDPEGSSVSLLKPAVLVDAVLAKRNLGTSRDMAPLTIALGPGFTAGTDVDFVIETMRGHNLGRIISSGPAKPDTGIPGNIGGYTSERVIHAQQNGILQNCRQIGDYVEKGERIAVIKNADSEYQVTASISGVIRGMLREGFDVKKGLKMADIDPRKESYENCFTISDKARCIAGSVLELVCRYGRTME